MCAVLYEPYFAVVITLALLPLIVISGSYNFTSPSLVHHSGFVSNISFAFISRPLPEMYIPLSWNVDRRIFRLPLFRASTYVFKSAIICFSSSLLGWYSLIGVLSTIMCEICLCHFLNKRQITSDFSYGL